MSENSTLVHHPQNELQNLLDYLSNQVSYLSQPSGNDISVFHSLSSDLVKSLFHDEQATDQFILDALKLLHLSCTRLPLPYLTNFHKESNLPFDYWLFQMLYTRLLSYQGNDPRVPKALMNSIIDIMFTNKPSREQLLGITRFLQELNIIVINLQDLLYTNTCNANDHHVPLARIRNPNSTEKSSVATFKDSLAVAYNIKILVSTLWSMFSLILSKTWKSSSRMAQYIYPFTSLISQGLEYQETVVDETLLQAYLEASLLLSKQVKQYALQHLGAAIVRTFLCYCIQENCSESCNQLFKKCLYLILDDAQKATGFLQAILLNQVDKAIENAGLSHELTCILWKIKAYMIVNTDKLDEFSASLYNQRLLPLSGRKDILTCHFSYVKMISHLVTANISSFSLATDAETVLSHSQHICSWIISLPLQSVNALLEELEPPIKPLLCIIVFLPWILCDSTLFSGMKDMIPESLLGSINILNTNQELDQNIKKLEMWDTQLQSALAIARFLSQDMYSHLLKCYRHVLSNKLSNQIPRLASDWLILLLNNAGGVDDVKSFVAFLSDNKDPITLETRVILYKVMPCCVARTTKVTNNRVVCNACDVLHSSDSERMPSTSQPSLSVNTEIQSFLLQWIEIESSANPLLWVHIPELLCRWIEHTSVADESIWKLESHNTLTNALQQSLSSNHAQSRQSSIELFEKLVSFSDRDINCSNIQVLYQAVVDTGLSNSSSIPTQEVAIKYMTVLIKACMEIEIGELFENVMKATLPCLDHTNCLMRALAFSKLKELIDESTMPSTTIFKDALPNLSYFIIKQVDTHPRILRSFASLVGESPPEFITSVMEFVLPRLVLDEQASIISIVAETVRKDVPTLLVEEGGHILPFILQNSSTTSPQEGLSYFMSMSMLETRGVSLNKVFRSCQLMLISKLIFSLGDRDASSQKRALSMLAFVESHLQKTSKGVETPSVEFLSHYFLGLISYMNDVLLEIKRYTPIVEKICVLQSLTFLFGLVNVKKLGSALPQIVGLLQSALDFRPLWDVTLRCWTNLIPILDHATIRGLLPQISSILLQIESQCTEYQRGLLQSLFSYIIVDHGDAFESEFVNLAPLPMSDIWTPLRQALEKRKSKHRSSADERWQQLDSILNRLENENVLVVRNALNQLRVVLFEESLSLLKEIAAEDKMDPRFARIISALFSTCRRYHAVNEEIARDCCACLGLLGAPDPARFDTTLSKEIQFDVAIDLDTSTGVMDFSFWLVEHYLAPSFRSLQDGTLQGHLAYTIQQILRYCGFKPEIVNYDPDNNTALNNKVETAILKIRSKWSAFSSSTIHVIEPLLTAKYAIQLPELERVTYPLYPKSETFSSWIIRWTMDLIDRFPFGPLKEPLVSCLNMLHEGDTNLAQRVLPHVVLYMIILEPDGATTDLILSECLSVLDDSSSSCPWPSASYASQPVMNLQSLSERQQLCSQIIFMLVDHMNSWVYKKYDHVVKLRSMLAKRGRRVVENNDLVRDEITIKRIESFLSAIPQSKMAEVSYRSKAYARAALHFESHIRLIRESVKSNGLEHASKKIKTPVSSESDSNVSDSLEDSYAKLQDIYAALDDPDSVQGISTKFHVPTLQQQITGHISVGSWSAAQTCYELLLHEDPQSIDYQDGLLKCLERLGQFDTVLTQFDGIKSRKDISGKSVPSQLRDRAIEAAWRTANWNRLENLVNLQADSKSYTSFEYLLGSLIFSVKNRDNVRISEIIRDIQSQLSAHVAAASLESYGRAYDPILKLSLVNDIETFFLHILDSEAGNDGQQPVKEKLQQILDRWETQMKLFTSSFTARERILNLRRVLLSLATSGEDGHYSSKIQSHISCLWLQTAKESRKAGFYQSAYNAILQCSQLTSFPQIHLERAKWVWKQGHVRQAISQLKNTVHLLEAMKLDTEQDSFKENQNPQSAHKVVIDLTGSVPSLSNQIHGDISGIKSAGTVLAKMKLLLTSWTEELSISSSKTILQSYKEICTMVPEWEKSCFFLGRYYNKTYSRELQRYTQLKSNGADDPDEKMFTHVLMFASLVVQQFARALTNGSKYIYQTLPRLLTVWLDMGYLCPEPPTKVTSSSKANDSVTRFAQINRSIRKMVDKLPAYQFLTAFPQLVSRISHKNSSVVTVLEHILSNITAVYPHQALWHLMSVGKSTSKIRSRRVSEILSRVKSDPSNRHNNVEQQIADAQNFTDHLIHLCNYPPPKDMTASLSMSRDFRVLLRMAPLNVLIPVQSSMTVQLPSSSFPLPKSTNRNGILHTHKAFPSRLATVRGFVDQIDIMPSLVRPKKIGIKGSDGKDYTFLCKPSDDLRKDSRLMELNGMINTFLRKNEEAHKRQLKIRTYAVVPLNEECGLIEWVNHMQGFRNIIIKIHKTKNIVINFQELKKWLDTKTSQPEKVFLEQILPRYPAVFHEWFLVTFPEPSKWLSSRRAYARTLATMSMVGHIVGLGDRHGENILFDENTGEALHVDLNCIFDKGLEFEKPERVPFRLTHNLVDALGVTAVEGAFRKSCEVTLGILREHRESLNTVLETFLHDPLCEWSKYKQRQNMPNPDGNMPHPAMIIMMDKKESSLSVENVQASRILSNIDKKLQGILVYGPGISGSNATMNSFSVPLSVEGHVDELISIATNPVNLFQMYIGWGAYL